jgi:hypothetical protein
MQRLKPLAKRIESANSSLGGEFLLISGGAAENTYCHVEESDAR